MNIPLYRILGTLLLLGAPITGWLQQEITVNVFLFILAGLILIITPEKRGLHTWHQFKKSFTRKAQFGWVLIYDVAFWLILAIVTLVYGKYMENKVAEVGLLDLQGAGMLDPTIVAQNVDVIRGFIIAAILGGIVSLLVLWIAYSYFSGAAWSRVYKRHYNQPLIKSFFSVSAALFGTGFVLFTLVIAATKPEVLLYTLPPAIIVAVHFTFFINAQTAKTRSAKNGIIEGLTSAVQIKQLLQPIAYVCTLYLLLMIIVTLTTPYQTVSLVTSGIALVLGSAWLKIYISEII